MVKIQSQPGTKVWLRGRQLKLDLGLAKVRGDSPAGLAASLLNFVEDLQKTIKIVPHFAEDTNQVLSSVSVVRQLTFLQRLQN